jgi:hypothetical protein
LLLIVGCLLLGHTPTFSAATNRLFPPAEYIQSNLQQNDILFLGTTHKSPSILKFIAKMIPALSEYGVTHIGLEIPSDQQKKIDDFMRDEGDLDEIQFHAQIDCPEYRNLFYILRISNGPIPLAIDLPGQVQ